MTEKLTFSNLGAVLNHFDQQGKGVEHAAAVYRSQLLELTGHDPSKQVTALDVIKIVQRVFFGGTDGNGISNGGDGATRERDVQRADGLDDKVVPPGPSAEPGSV